MFMNGIAYLAHASTITRQFQNIGWGKILDGVGLRVAERFKVSPAYKDRDVMITAV